MRNAVRATAIVAAAAAAWAAAASAAPPWSGPADISGVFATAGYDMATLMAAVVREQAYAIRGSAP